MYIYNDVELLSRYRVAKHIFVDLEDKISIFLHRLTTLSGQKYLYTPKYPCADCAIYRPKNQLGAKMGIETYKYQKFVVLALLW